MHTAPSSTPASRVARGRRPGHLLLAAAAVLAIATPLAGRAEAAPTSGPAGSTPTATPQATGGGHSVTLLTGDVVTVAGDAGHQAAWVEHPAQPEGRSAQVYSQDGQVHVVPAEAAPYVRSGALDPNLFNVSLLVREGFADDERTTLPLLVQSPSGATAGRAPAAPRGSRQVRVLDSIATVSVVADKSAIRTVWGELRGARPAAVNATGARLATANKVWLNATVKAAVEDGAAQIGAPDAWRAGYDGRGVHVAVLDTGYDPTHPDLRGRVTKARNFTAEADPAGETAVDGNGHGTHVAATVAGTGKASHGVYEGVAPGADLWIGKVLGSDGIGSFDQIVAGMQWAADAGADVVNMSLGEDVATDGTDPMSEAVDQLTASSGALFVIAAGNYGPTEQSVTAPGSADAALTVGAVDGNDEPAAFSSRGPRVGDEAIKPEIVAPGVGIVSARAAGTSEGNLLDRYYTALDGTSMATPHVAGSAAILAQEHPGWTAPQLKAQLIETSKTLPDQPVTFQGAGRVDVAAAVHDRVTSATPVLSLGHVTQGGASVRRKLTYANPTGHTARLRLTDAVHGSGIDSQTSPDLVLDRNIVDVPAHGQATVGLTLFPKSTGAGQYSGQIVAQAQGSGAAGRVHSVVSFVVDGRPRTVTVHAVDRDGKPASGPVDLWNEGTGDPLRVWLTDGTATAQVPDGDYTLMATLADQPFQAVEQTVVGDPQLSVHADVTLDFDARDGRPVTVTTPREADLTQFSALWSRTIGDRSVSMVAAQGSFGARLYVIPSNRARRGTFQFATQWHLGQPMLVARTTGPSAVRLPDPQFVSFPDPFVGTKTLPLVFAGAGTAADFGAVDARGKIALITRDDQHGLFAQVEAAKNAGVAVLFVQNTDAGYWRPEALRQGLATYTLDQSAGDQLRGLLTADPGLTLQLTGRASSQYSYGLVFADSRIPATPQYTVDRDSLATVVSDYRQNSARMASHESWIPHIGSSGMGAGMALPRIGPVVRTDYLSTRDVAWQQLGQPSFFANMYWTETAVQQYRAGDTDHQLWWGPLVAPGVPPRTGVERYGWPVARFRDAIRIVIPHYYYGGTAYGFTQEQLGDTSHLELRRGNEVIGTSTWPQAQFTVPAKRAQYDLSMSVHTSDRDGSWSDTSIATQSTWRFTSARSTAERTVLPLVQLGYDLDTDGFNRMPAGAAYPLTITPGYQPGASGPGTFTVRVQVSSDDGKTWQSAPVAAAHGRFQATVPAADGPGFASVRVVATDSEGNRLTQEIDRAWRIA